MYPRKINSAAVTHDTRVVSLPTGTSYYSRALNDFDFNVDYIEFKERNQTQNSSGIQEEFKLLELPHKDTTAFLILLPPSQISSAADIARAVSGFFLATKFSFQVSNSRLYSNFLSLPCYPFFIFTKGYTLLLHHPDIINPVFCTFQKLS